MSESNPESTSPKSHGELSASRWLQPVRAYGAPLGTAQLKKEPADFQVTERLSAQPIGEGEHAWVRIRKAGINSHDVIQYWRKCLKLPERAFGLAGKKDKNAVAEQTISVQLPGQPNPSIEQLEMPGVEILSIDRHQQKLRPAVGRGNAFCITLRECQLASEDGLKALQQRLQKIEANGVPNYFGPQRFGRNGDNAERAAEWFAGQWQPRSRNLQGLLLSAARSAIFNCVLSERVTEDSWRTVKQGEWLQFADGNTGFAAEPGDQAIAALQQRVDSGELQTTGPLIGEGDGGVHNACLAFEQHVYQPFSTWQQGLVQHRMRADRRSLICPVQGLSAEQVENSVLRLRFELAAGQYATTVLAELFDLVEE